MMPGVGLLLTVYLPSFTQLQQGFILHGTHHAMPPQDMTHKHRHWQR